MYKDYVSLIDLVLVPIYLLAIIAVLIVFRKKNPDNLLYRRFLVKGFVYKAGLAILYALLVYYYYGVGDTLTYFYDAQTVKSQMEGIQDLGTVLFKDYQSARDTYGLIGAGSNGGWFIERMALVLSYISFDRVLIVTIFFAAITYPGMLKMVEAFSYFMPGWQGRIALIVLFFPSVVFYGSGILKDAICISCMGWIMYGTVEIFSQKIVRLQTIIIMLLCSVLIGIVKIYILAAFILPLVLFILMNFLKKIESPFIRRMLLPFFFLMLIGLYIPLKQQIDGLLGNYAVETIFEAANETQQQYSKSEEMQGGSSFSVGTIEPSFTGFLKVAPLGIVASLYRPFIWESNKIVMLFSALESLILLLLTLRVMYKAGIGFFFRQIFTNPFIMLCTLYSLILAALIGVSTPNFGTLARYRIIIIPFYLAGVLAILYQSKLVTKKIQHGNTA